MYEGLECSVEGFPPRAVEEIGAFAARHREELRAAQAAGRFPAEIYREMGARGWVGPGTARRDGGLGGGVAEYCVVEEEVGRHGLVSPQIAVQGQRWLQDWGTDEQRDRYLAPMARGELIFSESISEPGVGSSLREMRSMAHPDGSDWILNGRKTHVNLGCECDVTLVYAIAPRGLTAFLVDAGTPGFTTARTDPIGLRLIPTAEMAFEDVRVPGTAVLGEVGGGMDTFLSTFNVSRLGNASELLGFGRRALADAVEYGASRSVGGSKVTDFQGIQWTVADRYADLYAASLARNRAAALVDQGAEHALATTLAKKLSITAAEAAANEAFALTGGHGLYTDTDFGQILHDVKVLRVAGGSLEVLRNYIGRRVLRDPVAEGLA